MSELEIQDELKGQGVAGFHQVTGRKNGEVTPSRILFLTAQCPSIGGAAGEGRVGGCWGGVGVGVGGRWG